MNDREKWRERVRDICACGTIWVLSGLESQKQLRIPDIDKKATERGDFQFLVFVIIKETFGYPLKYCSPVYNRKGNLVNGEFLEK